MGGKSKPEVPPAGAAGEQPVEKTAKQLEKEAKKAAKMEKFKEKLQKPAATAGKESKPKETKSKSAKPESAAKDVVIGKEYFSYCVQVFT